MSNYSIIIVDTIITGIALIITGLYLGGTEQLIKDLAKLRGFTLLAFVAAAACVTISSVIALNLIRTEKLSYLVIVILSILSMMVESKTLLSSMLSKLL